jgi:hypothetical protein
MHGVADADLFNPAWPRTSAVGPQVTLAPMSRLNKTEAVIANMNCDIVVRSYRKDLDWLGYCLTAIRRHAFGFRQVLVALPRSTGPWLRRNPVVPDDVCIEWCDDYGDDYLGQQVTKLYADLVSDADLLCHIDADCLLAERTTPEDLAPDGRPWVVTQPVFRVDRHVPWRWPTEEFLGWEIDHDFMQQPPFVYPRLLYPAIRQHCRERHHMELSDYVLSRPARGFSEFNVLGAYAYARHPDLFRWAEGAAAPRARCAWFWSWGGLQPPIRAQVQSVLRV